jgi:heme-degrading monooxygenase HmoA
MICRLWHGWTSPANADAYERLLREEIFVGIAARGIAGFRGIELLRRATDGEVEFVTLMRFESLDDVRAFAGADYVKAVVPESARRILARFDTEAVHYAILSDPDGIAP